MSAPLCPILNPATTPQPLSICNFGWLATPVPPCQPTFGASKVAAKATCLQQWHRPSQGHTVGWLDASISEPSAFDTQWDVVLMDDVQAYSAVQQHAAFNWFVHAATPGSARQPWVLAAGLLPPQDLPLREDLRTRLGWGHVFHLQVLGENERRAVLVRHAQALGMTLNTDLLDYLLSRFSRDLGHLIDLLHRLDAFALQTQRPLTIPLLRAMLDES
jgi:DnaA-homolog protein